jgi:nucleotide-binding universal stress UspA family protein
MTYVFVVLAGVWLAIGIASAIVMGRRGHDPWSWGVLGAVFGPLVVPLAVAVHRRDRRPFEERVLHLATGHGPGVSVLVGIDGSPEADAAAEAVMRLLGDRIASVTLATVVDLDAANAIRELGGGAYERAARAELDRVAARMLPAMTTTVVLAGRPADALLSYAERHGMDLVAIGARGRGLSERVLGSVAEQLVRAPNVVTLVAGRVTANAVSRS